jgi:putative transposase
MRFNSDFGNLLFERANYRFFLEKFWEYFPPSDSEVHAYCLLPNHYHLLIQLTRDFDFSIRMRYFTISYAKSLNSWGGRAGHVFQGRFKAKLVGSTEYLLHLSRYIHSNPVSARLVRVPQEWEFSSYRDYLEDSRNLSQNSREIPGIYTRPKVTTEYILSHFAGVENYQSFVESNDHLALDALEGDLWM